MERVKFAALELLEIAGKTGGGDVRLIFKGV
jgi:hypothetical protein